MAKKNGRTGKNATPDQPDNLNSQAYFTDDGTVRWGPPHATETVGLKQGSMDDLVKLQEYQERMRKSTS